MGPPVAMKIAKGALVQQMSEGGCALAVEHDILPYQYFLVFKPR